MDNPFALDLLFEPRGDAPVPRAVVNAFIERSNKTAGNNTAAAGKAS